MAITLNGSSGITTPAVTASTAIGTASGGTGLSGATPFTANGVVFASSASALTTGSALTFDGTNLGLSGTGARFINLGSTSTNGQSVALQISAPNSDASASVYRIGSGLTADNELVAYDVTSTQTVDKYIRGSSGFRAFFQNGSEQMRLTSTGLGIGTSSPSTKLHVAGVVVSSQGVMKIQDLGGSGTGAFPVISLYDAGGTNQGNLGMFAGDQVIENKTASGKILFKTNSATVATLDSSGSVGIGTSSPGQKLTVIGEIALGASSAHQSSRIAVADSTSGTTDARFLFRNGTDTDAALRLIINGASAIALDAVRANNSAIANNIVLQPNGGNVGIGTNSPGAKLEVVGGVSRFSRADVTPLGTANIIADDAVFGSTDTPNTGITIFGSNELGVYFGSAAANAVGQMRYQLATNKFEWTVNSGAAIQMSLTSDGTFRVKGAGSAGTTDAFQVAGGAPADAARIDSSGRLLVGATSQPAFFSAAAKIYVEMSGSDYTAAFRNTNESPGGVAVSYTTTPNNTSNYFLDARDNTAQRFAVKSNGGIDNFSANNSNLSDRREKINFAPAKSYLETICAIPVQTFNYIDQNMEEDGGLTLGVVAQDVQAVAPELVMESNWASKDTEPKMRLSIYQTDLQYALMKCIQEQQALITALTARITALESN